MRSIFMGGACALALALGAGGALATTAPVSGGSNSASQSNATTQVVPIAVSAPVTAPVNANVPVTVLGDNNGNAGQSNTTTVNSEATNNRTEQVIVQGPGCNSASQPNATTQLLPIAAALPVTLPVNLNAPVTIGSDLPELL